MEARPGTSTRWKLAFMSSASRNCPCGLKIKATMSFAASGMGGPRGRSVVGSHRRGDDEAGDVAEHPDRIVVVEVAAEPALVAEARDPDDHPVAVRALGEELQRRRLAPQLILGVVQ